MKTDMCSTLAEMSFCTGLAVTKIIEASSSKEPGPLLEEACCLLQKELDRTKKASSSKKTTPQAKKRGRPSKPKTAVMEDQEELSLNGSSSPVTDEDLESLL